MRVPYGVRIHPVLHVVRREGRRFVVLWLAADFGSSVRFRFLVVKCEVLNGLNKIDVNAYDFISDSCSEIESGSVVVTECEGALACQQCSFGRLGYLAAIQFVFLARFDCIFCEPDFEL